MVFSCDEHRRMTYRILERQRKEKKIHFEATVRLTRRVTRTLVDVRSVAESKVHGICLSNIYIVEEKLRYRTNTGVKYRF